MAAVAELRLAHTADLDAGDRRAVRALLDEAFDQQFTDEAYEHALGGVHALVWEGAELVGHGSVVMRRLLHRERALRTGYVEAVAVRADRRRRGHGHAVMTALERVIGRAYELGALAASDQARDLYAARGWQPWSGRAWVVTLGGGVKRTEQDEGSIYVLPVSVELDPHGDLACDWRDGEVW